MLVSSANKIETDLSFMNLGKSFMNLRKSKGLKTKPSWTPRSNLDQVDVIILPFLLHSSVL